MLFLFAIFSCLHKNESESFENIKNKLGPLCNKMGRNYNGTGRSWINHANMSFSKYKSLKPVRPDSLRKTLYILPLGKFDSTEYSLVPISAEYLEAYYGIAVRVLPTIGADVVPAKHTRNTYMSIFECKTLGSTTSCQWVDTPTVQLNTKYLFRSVLKPALPNDAIGVIALTNKDIYPSDTHDFVFGIASLSDRVGVWSFARFGDVHKKEDFKTILIRTLKIASHETGHMFSIRHCYDYHCVLNGTEGLFAVDGRPVWLCPDCLEKYCWNFKTTPAEQFIRLSAFWRKYGFETEAKVYEKFIEALNKK